jgi:hypothetical protein
MSGQLLSPEIPHLILLQGGQSKKELAAALAQLAQIPDSVGRVVLATGGYIGEGFDDPRLDTLFLALPVSWRGTIAQYVGRLHRLHEGKREVRVYDYADLNVPMLSRMFDRRCRGYESLGYTILLPGSALPGWPSEVPLPIDPEWKRDYAASVRRLIRDGVDVPWRICSCMWPGTPRQHRGRSSRPERQRSLSFSPPANLARDVRSFSFECGVADFIRRPWKDGGGLVMRGSRRGH